MPVKKHDIVRSPYVDRTIMGFQASYGRRRLIVSQM